MNSERVFESEILARTMDGLQLKNILGLLKEWEEFGGVSVYDVVSTYIIARKSITFVFE